MAVITQDYFCPRIGMASEFRVVLPESGSGVMTDAESTLFLLSPEGESGLRWITSTKLRALCDQYRTAAVLVPCLQGCYTDMAYGYPFYQSLKFVREYIQIYLRGIPVGEGEMAIAGASAGGTAALRWAMEDPGLFSAGASLSGMYFPDREPGGWFTENRLESLYGDPAYRPAVRDEFLQLCRGTGQNKCYIFSSQEDTDRALAEKIAEILGDRAVFRTAEGRSDWKIWSDRLADFMCWWKEGNA